MIEKIFNWLCLTEENAKHEGELKLLNMNIYYQRIKNTKS